MDRRPPHARGPSMGRPHTTLEAERDHRFDEEALREEHTHLRTAVAGLRREAAEVRDRLKAAEKDSLRKDKILQELLATAKCASGVPAEALDQLREELQGLLHFKRLAHDVRQTLEEKEQNFSAFQQELKSTSILNMEEDVGNVKADAKTKADEWVDLNADKPSWCFSESQRQQRKAKDLVNRIQEAESAISQSQQRLIRLQDQRSKLQQAVEDQSLQVEKLQEKRSEIELQREQCEARLRELGDVEQQHARLQKQCEERLEQVAQARQAGLEQKLLRESAAAAASRASLEEKGWEVRERLLAPGFQPLRFDAADEQKMQLWRIRQALEAGGGRSLLNVLFDEDANQDGYVTAEELSNALRKLRLPSTVSELGAVRRLIAMLDPELLGGAGGPTGTRTVSSVDFALALPLQPPPDEAFDEELAAAAEALSWACRRRYVAEAELRADLAAWISDPSTDLVAKATTFCIALGLDPKTASMVARGLELRRLRFAMLLPHWRMPQPKVRAAVLARFAREVATRRDILAPALAVEFMSMESLLHVSAMLGDHWSREELEEVAMSAEATEAGAGCGAPPVVAAARLVRAATRPGGLADGFPEFNEHWHPDALAACDKAAAAPPRRAAMARTRPAAEVAASPVASAPLSPTGVAVAATAAAIGGTQASEIACSSPQQRSPAASASAAATSPPASACFAAALGASANSAGAEPLAMAMGSPMAVAPGPQVPFPAAAVPSVAPGPSLPAPAPDVLMPAPAAGSASEAVGSAVTTIPLAGAAAPGLAAAVPSPDAAAAEPAVASAGAGDDVDEEESYEEEEFDDDFDDEEDDDDEESAGDESGGSGGSA